jgi:hypothetical protein
MVATVRAAPGLVEDRRFYRCDCPVAAEVWTQDAAGTLRPLDLAEVECGAIARYVWKVRMRHDGSEGLIARCVLPGHADTVKRFLRHPDRSYDLVEAILPIEHPSGGYAPS